MHPQSQNYKGYGENCWGLTASYSVKGYAAHAPNEKEDHGVISPTAALSSIVYTPEESIDVMKYLYQKKDKTWGDYGFYDAFSETENWYPQQYLAIDQGPIAIMIETIVHNCFGTCSCSILTYKKDCAN